MTIVWSAQALRDLISLRRYIAEHNPTAAADTAARLLAAIENLPDFPSQGRPGRLPETRELVVTGTPYIVPYRVSDDRLEIIAVIHGARQWPDADDRS